MHACAKIILKNSYEDGTEAFIGGMYVHLGGEPRRCGKFIAQAVIQAALTPCETHCGVEAPVLNNRNWAQHFLKDLCSTKLDLQFLDEKQLDSYATDYTYVVTGEYDDCECLEGLDSSEYLSRLGIECFSRDTGSLVYVGGASTFLNWCDVF